jgi:DeoR/GlpR family transcriptional regulator of sugar metabolism
MVKEQRFEYILHQLKTKEQVTYEELAGSLELSEDTIRRDIEYLHRNGLLSKVRGGAMLPSKNPLTFQDRSNSYQDEKDLIAAKARGLLRPGMTVFMDGGTTICAIAASLTIDMHLRVITNNIPAIQLLTQYKNIELIVLGGTYEPDTATTTGTITCLDVERYTADVYFMGTCGVDDRFGVSAAAEQDAHVKRAMLKRSKKIVSLVNDKLLHHTAAFHVCDFRQIDVMITNLDSDHADLDAFRDHDVKIV